ncbi:C-type mannose receptor 2-like isoform X1 [Hyposmocoma kahamanoa]|uniref:C-type mannose receptor 2-like isoform X1 n=1 Tax=Hyposmocoma kahamanoa TaxID=1477025 RepID=UPI000E6D74A8|nr:C-type mannose receptor 2-like isoform X1 [Hyposmocoma kahamanoa]
MLRLFLSVFLVVTLDAERWHTQPPNFRPDYVYVPSINGWLKLHRVPTSWNDAYLQCRFEGAELASPLNDPMMQIMLDVTERAGRANCGIYTGINAWFSDGVYTSIDGTPLSKMPVEFTNSQTCPQMVTSPCTVLLPSGAIDIVDCKHLYFFMCYRKVKKGIPNINECGTIDSEYKYYKTTGHCYKFHLQPQIWSDAYKICLAEGGRLAIINSAEEAKFLSSIFEMDPSSTLKSTKISDLFLGFIKFNKSWITIDGESLEETGYAIWAPDEPNNSPRRDKPDYLDRFGSSESCGAMQRDGLLNDCSCDIPLAFVCEKHLVVDVIERETPTVVKLEPSSI